MAHIGLKYFAGAKIATEPDDSAPTYETGFVIGKSVSTNLAVTNAEGKLYADDELAEYVNEFSSADLTAEVDNIDLDKQAVLYGADYTDNELGFGADDQAPEMGTGGVQVIRVNGVRKFRTWFLAKCKAAIPDWGGSTRGDSISFGTQPIKMKVTAPKFGKWYRVKQFDTYAAAKAHIDTLLNVGTWYKVNVMANGAGTGESVKQIGTNAVASGGEIVINITGTATALYDNGVDKISDVSGGKYTLSSIAANHDIAVIF